MSDDSPPEVARAFFSHPLGEPPTLLDHPFALWFVVQAVGGLVGVFALGAPRFFETWDGDVRDPRAVALLLIAAQAWGWVLALWGLGMRLPAFRRPLPRDVGDAAMPFFVLHQPVILAVAVVVVEWSLATPVQWLLIVVPSFVLAAALAWASSRTPGVRRLLGVKPRAAPG